MSSSNVNISKIASSDMEIKLHIEELLKTLTFLHNDVRIAHVSLSPENVYIMPDGKWKLGGFMFSTQILTNNMSETNNVDFTTKPSDAYIRTNPNLAFVAPEVVELPSKCTFSSDIFSLGLLLCSIFISKEDMRSTGEPYLINP